MAEAEVEAGATRRILVVNDTQEILELFVELLGGMGHDVIPLTYAPDDLQQIVAHHPDLAIIDFVLGVREFLGWQLVQKMRMKPETADIPIIICTAARTEVREQEGWLTEKGISVVLKPFELIDLERAANRALRLPALLVEHQERQRAARAG